jgi:hypothetical protein
MKNGYEWGYIGAGFIAVRDDLVPALGGIEPVHLDAKSLLKPK